MSQVIENKVVEMRFDNQQFEQGVKQSMDSLNQLNNSLDNVGNDTKAFSGITDALNNLNVAVGKINPLRWKLWEDIYNAAKGVGSRLVGAIMTPIQMASSGGWTRALNIEQAKFQLEGAGQDVEVAFKSASEAVNDTAYSLDEAASIASQLAGSGMQAGDEMTKVLKSISGVAAQTMGSYRDIGDIFVDINSAGKVTGDALNRLAMRGLNAKADLAEALGTTEANIAKMVSKGQISFKQFADAMSKYTDHAFKANETYSGSLANLHSALNKIGADFNQYKIKDMVTLFNSLRLMVNKVRKELTPISEIYGKIHAIGVKLISDFIDKLDFKWLTPVFDGLANIFLMIIKVGAAVADVIKDMFPKNFGNTIQNIAERFRDFTERLSISQETLGKIQMVVRGAIALFEIIFTIIKQLVSGIFNIGSSVGGLGETILTVAAYIGELLIRFNEWLQTSDAITVAINKLKDALFVVGVVAVGLVLKVVDFVKAIKDSEIVVSIINNIKGGFDKLKDSITGIKKAASTEAPGQSKKEGGGVFGTIISQLKKLREMVESVVGEITPAKVAIAAAVAVILGLVVAIIVVVNKLSNSVKSLSGSINFVGNIRKWIEDYKKAAEEAGEAAEKKAKFAKFLILVGEIAAFVFALKGLASQPLQNILAATISMLAIIAVIWRMSEDINKIPKGAEKNWRVLGALAVLMNQIGSALSKAAKQPWNQLLAAGAAMTAVILSLVPVIKAVGKIQPNDLKNISGRTGLIGTLVLAFSPIGSALAKAAKHPWGQLLAAGAAIAGCMLSLGALIAIISKIDADNLKGKTIVGILALCVGLVPIGSAISKIAAFNWTQIAAASIGLVATIAVLGLIVAALAKIDKPLEAVAGAAALLIASYSLVNIGEALSQVTFYNWDSMWQSLIAINGTLAVLTICLGILAAIGAGTEGIGAIALIAAAAAIWICGEAVLAIGEASIKASVAIQNLAQAFVILSHDVDFSQILVAGQTVIQFLEDFDHVAWGAIKAAISLRLGGEGFAAFAQGLQSLANVDISIIADNIVKIFDAIGEGLSKIDGWGVEMEIFALAFTAFGEVLKGLSLASIALGAGLVLAGVGMVAAGAGLQLMEEPLKSMQDLDWDILVYGLESVASAFIKFGVIAAILGIFSTGLAAAAISLGAMAVECWAFTNFDLNAIADGLMSMAGSGAALGGAGILMVAGAVGVGAMAVAIGALGVAVGGAAVLIAKGIDSIVSAVEKLNGLKTAGANAVQGFINGITSKVPAAIKSGLSLASGFYNSVIRFLGIHSPSVLLRTVGEFTGSGFIIGIADKMDEAEKSGKGLSLSALAGVSGMESFFGAEGAKDAGAYAGSFSSILNSFFGGKDFSVTGANGMPSDVAAKMKKSGVGGLNGLLDQFNSKLFDTKEIEKEVEKASKGAAGGLDTLGDSAGKAGKKAKEAKDEMASFYDKIEGAISLFDEFKKEDPMDPAKLIENMKSQIDGIANWSTQIQQLSTKGIDQGLLKKLADLGPQGAKYTQAFVNMTAEQMAEANKYYQQSLILPQHVTAQVYGSFAIAGSNAKEGFINGLDKESLKEEGVTFAKNFLDNVKDFLEIASPSKVMYDQGEYTSLGFKDGIKSPYVLGLTSEAARTLANKVITALKENLIYNNEMYNVGKNAVTGLTNGIKEAKKSAVDAIADVANSVIAKAKSPSCFWERSPSRVFTQMGKYIDEGLANGIHDNTDTIYSSVQSMSDRTIDIMRSAVSKIQDASNLDIDTEPVIRPVFDMSKINDNIGYIGSMINEGIMPNISLNTSNPIDYITQANLVNNNADVVNAINFLSNDVQSLKDAMTNIKMVLDTGTMVGAMTPAIDQQLGMRQVYAGRGI